MTSGKGRGFLARFFSVELRMWRGEAPLAPLFWGHGVLLSSFLLALYGAAIYSGRPLLEQFLLVCLGLYTLWILIAIWRSAANDNTVWSLLARMLTVAWAANIVLILLFREVELLTLFCAQYTK